MEIRINKTIGIVIIVLSALNLCLFLTLLVGAQKTDVSLGLSSLVGIGIGLLFLRGVYFEVSQNSLILKALIGNSHKVYSLTSPKDLSLEGKDVFLTRNGNRQKLSIYSWIADQRDWKVFAQWLGEEI